MKLYNKEFFFITVLCFVCSWQANVSSMEEQEIINAILEMHFEPFLSLTDTFENKNMSFLERDKNSQLILDLDTGSKEDWSQKELERLYSLLNMSSISADLKERIINIIAKSVASGKINVETNDYFTPKIRQIIESKHELAISFNGQQIQFNAEKIPPGWKDSSFYYFLTKSKVFDSICIKNFEFGKEHIKALQETFQGYSVFIAFNGSYAVVKSEKDVSIGFSILIGLDYFCLEAFKTTNICQSLALVPRNDLIQLDVYHPEMQELLQILPKYLHSIKTNSIATARCNVNVEFFGQFAITLIKAMNNGIKLSKELKNNAIMHLFTSPSAQLELERLFERKSKRTIESITIPLKLSTNINIAEYPDDHFIYRKRNKWNYLAVQVGEYCDFTNLIRMIEFHKMKKLYLTISPEFFKWAELLDILKVQELESLHLRCSFSWKDSFYKFLKSLKTVPFWNRLKNLQLSELCPQLILELIRYLEADLPKLQVEFHNPYEGPFHEKFIRFCGESHDDYSIEFIRQLYWEKFYERYFLPVYKNPIKSVKELVIKFKYQRHLKKFIEDFLTLFPMVELLVIETTDELETLEIKNEFLEELIIECKCLKDESVFLQNLLDLPHLISVDIKQEKKRIQWRREGKQIYTEIQI